MKCKYCGKDLMEGAKFCVYCGKPIEVEEHVIVKSEPIAQKVEQSTNETISDPFAILEQKKNEAANQPTMPQMPEVPVAPKMESTPVQPELETKIPSVPAKDPFEVLDQNVVEKTVPEINSTEEVSPVEPDIQTQPLEQVKEEITNVTVKPNVEVSKETPSEPTSVQLEVVPQPEPTPIELPKEPEKQEINIEPKIVKKNNPILIIIIFILLAIIIGGGIFVYTKYIAPSNNKNASNPRTTNNEASGKEQDYDLVKAKELIDKYYVSYLSDNIFTDGITLATKNRIALKNISSEYKSENNCDVLYENNSNARKEGTGYGVTLNPTLEELKGKINAGGCDLGSADTYKYEDVNNVYKALFGKNENVSKSDFMYYIGPYDYIEDKAIFVLLNARGGGAIGPHFTTYGVQSAKIIGEKLIVDVGYIGVDVPSSIKLGNEEVTITEEDVQKDTFEKDFLDKYLDKLDTYEFTFKYEDDHYVFVNMKKA